MKVRLSVVIPTCNEYKNLPRTLKAVKWADEIFVVDSNSIDGTQGVAKEHGAEVVQFKYKEPWPKKKNWALENLPFKHEWVLILDADEELSPEAEEEIRELCERNNRSLEGYFINRRFMFMGKWLRHAYYPNWNLRLFKHRLGRYEKLTDLSTESGDVEIHEHIKVRGIAGKLKSEINHYAFPSVEEFVRKHNRYSNWEARVLSDSYLDKGSASNMQSAELSWRRRVKKLSRRMPFRSILRFLYIYVFQLGFLDGREGYYFARLHAFYEFLCVCKTYEFKKSRKL